MRSLPDDVGESEDGAGAGLEKIERREEEKDAAQRSPFASTRSRDHRDALGVDPLSEAESEAECCFTSNVESSCAPLLSDTVSEAVPVDDVWCGMGAAD